MIVQQIRAATARISPLSLRRLREGLFKLELQIIEDMITGGIDPVRVTALSHYCNAIAAVEMLSGDLRTR
jgi:hypothetical protein